MPYDYDTICDRLEANWEDQDGDEFRAAFSGLQSYVLGGGIDGAEYLAEIRWLDGPHQDLEDAYRWYYVTHAHAGALVEYHNESGMPDYYCGPSGDFRNESVVSNLIDRLGLERIRALDIEAALLLSRLREM